MMERHTESSGSSGPKRASATLICLLAFGTGAVAVGPLAIEGNWMCQLGLWAPPEWVGFAWNSVALAVFFALRRRRPIVAPVVAVALMAVGLNVILSAMNSQVERIRIGDYPGLERGTEIRARLPFPSVVIGASGGTWLIVRKRDDEVRRAREVVAEFQHSR